MTHKSEDYKISAVNTLTGGAHIYGFRTAADKLENKRQDDYNKFKEQTRAEFDKKTKDFFSDKVKLNEFMDNNEIKI